MFRSNAEGFWAMADAILLMSAFNAAVFSAVVVLVLALVSHLFVKGRQKEFAIARSLGTSVYKIILRTSIALVLLALPAAAIGGVLAWNFAISEASAVLSPFAESATAQMDGRHFGLDFVGQNIYAAAQPEMPLIWLIVFVMIVFGFMFIVILAFSFAILRRPVLAQLQGRQQGAALRKSKAIKVKDSTEVSMHKPFSDLPDFNVKPQPSAATKSALSWVFAHILRSPAKTILVIFVSAFFVIALGWLQESMQRTGDDIDYIYDTTIVHAEFDHDGAIFLARERIQMLEQSPFTDLVVREAVHSLSFVIPADTHYAWHEEIGFDPNARLIENEAAGIFNNLLGINYIDEFIAAHSVGIVGGDYLGLHIDFIYGFEYASFIYHDEALIEVVPIVISQDIALQRGLSLGDAAYIGYSHLPATLTPMRFVPAVVVGVHNQSIYLVGYEAATLVPFNVLEYMLGSLTHYIDVRLTIDTVFNRDISEAHEEISHILLTSWPRPFGHFEFGRRLHIFDEELRNVAHGMGQILLLLELLYPAALILAVSIGAMLSALLLLRSERNAAIMRVLGMQKIKTRVILCLENLFVCVAGLVIALVALFAMDWGFGIYDLLLIAGLYLSAAVIGSVIGAILITARPPLELLQVRE